MALRLKTKTGRLTHYGFACGYVERKSAGGQPFQGIETEIWMEGKAFHVRQGRWSPTRYSRQFWDVFDTLNEARDRFNRCPGVLLNRIREDV